MSVHGVPCRTCDGSGEVEAWVRATFPTGAVATPEECSERVQREVAREPDGVEVEWDTRRCRPCGGSGTEQIERMPPGVRVFAP